MPNAPDFRLLFESVPGLYLVLTPAFQIVAASDAYLGATMTTRDEILGRHIFEIFPDNPDEPGATGVKNLKASLTRVLEAKRSDTMAVQKYDIRRSASQGRIFEERYWSPVNSPVIDEMGDVKYIIHRVEDVTDYIRLRRTSSERQVSMEAEIHRRGQELQQVNERLRASLAEKETLLKEVHHRVKNNLEVINSLLNLQADRVLHPGDRELLEETCNRVRSMAEIHQILYRSLDLSCVDVRLFLRRLAESLFSFYQVKSDRVHLVIEMEDLSVDLQRAIPVALILNELLSNALKHGFPDGRPGTIRVRVDSNGQESILYVGDDGVGLRQGRNREASSSLGLQLVHALADQLGGNVALQSPPGTQFTIRFPS